MIMTHSVGDLQTCAAPLKNRPVTVRQGLPNTGRPLRLCGLFVCWRTHRLPACVQRAEHIALRHPGRHVAETRSRRGTALHPGRSERMPHLSEGVTGQCICPLAHTGNLLQRLTDLLLSAQHAVHAAPRL